MTAPAIDGLSAAIFLAVGIAAGIVTARRPAWGVALLIVVDPFALYRYVGPTTLTLPKVALIGFIAGLFVRGVPFAPLMDRTARPLLAGALAILAANALSALQADFLAPVVRETLKALEYLVVFAGALVAFSADPDERPIWLAVCASTLAVVLLAIPQEFWGAPSVVAVGGHVVPRIAGPLEGPNQLAGYLGLAIPVLLAGALRLQPLATVALIAAALGDVLTFSRAGIISLVPAVLVVIWFLRRRAFIATAVSLTALLATALAARGIREIDVPSGLGTRSQLWHGALALWRMHPWLGVGAGNFELELPRVGLGNVHTHANSLYLQSLVEGGIPMLVATLWTVFASIATFVRRAAADPLIAGILGASVGLAVHQILDDLVFFPKVGFAWWLLLGIAAARAVTQGKLRSS